MQRTFGETVGMEPIVPCGPHRDDIVVCSDDTECGAYDAFEDCRDNFHSNEEDRDEANLMIVTEVMDNIVQWADDYTTNDDYADPYYCILDDTNYDEAVSDWVDVVVYDCDDWVDILVEAFDNNELDSAEYDKIMEEGKDDPTVDQEWGLDDYIKDRFCKLNNDYITGFILEHLDVGFDCEPIHGQNEYSAYYGNGVCLGGFDIGEVEEQVDITCHDELLELHNQGLLNDCLKKYNGEGCINLDRRREKNEKTGYYEYTGEESYDPYNRGSTTFEVYTIPGGRWDFVVPEERMNELRREAIVAYAEETLEK